MTQTQEEKAARRKARRARRKEARSQDLPVPSATPTPKPTEEDEEDEEVSVVHAQRPHSGFRGFLFEKFTDEILGNPDSFRIYTEKLNLLGVIKYDHIDKNWWISATRWPEDWTYPSEFPSIDDAVRVLYNHYLALITQDLPSGGAKA